MELILHGVEETRTIHGYNPGAKSLHALLGPHAEAVDWCRINGHPTSSWDHTSPSRVIALTSGCGPASAFPKRP